jgi:hypothetical protein
LPEIITLTCSGFDWLMPEYQVDVESDLTARPFFGLPMLSETTHYTYSRPLANLNGSKRMYRRPLPGVCEWLWSDCRNVKTVMRDFQFNDSPVLEQTLYEPVNADDPENPWNRVYTPFSDSRCNEPGWFCLTGAQTNVINSASLSLVRLTESGEFAVDGVLHWYLMVNVVIGRSAINHFIETIPAQSIYNSSVNGVNRVTPVGYTMRSAYDIYDVNVGATATPPYRWNGAQFFPLGAGVLAYVRRVNCDTDFGGSPITLRRESWPSYLAGRPESWDITYPAEVTIAL